MRYEVGSLVFSMAGHDKAEAFIIWKECGEYVYLVNGKERSVEKPKRKNKKHIQITHMKDDIIYKKLTQGGVVTDQEIRSFIRGCAKRIQVVEEE